MTFFSGFFILAAYCYFRNGYSLKDISLPDWLNYFAASGTVGGFLYLLIDKILSEKEENHLKWQSEIPFITLASPCDPTLNYCDINILENASSFEGRGYEYFSVCNLGKVNAYDITILFSTDENFTETKIFRRHYINHLCPLKVFGGIDRVYYEFKEAIYSMYNVDPETKVSSDSRFDLCNCISDCRLSPNSATEKYFFVKFTYYSSFAKKHRYKIVSNFKAHVLCSQQALEGVKEKTISDIRIKGITLTNYEYQFV